MKKYIKIIFILVVMLMLLILVKNESYANTVTLIEGLQIGPTTLTQMNLNINTRLKMYVDKDYKFEFNETGTYNKNWNKDNKSYKLNIKIEQKTPNNPNSYIATIVSLTSTTKDNTYQALDGTEVENNSKNNSNSSTNNNSPLMDPLENPDYYTPTNKGGNTELVNFGNVIIGAMQVAGTIISVITLMIIGLKYMLGSIEEKASYKEKLIPYIIGAIMVFTIPNVLRVIWDLVSSISL